MKIKYCANCSNELIDKDGHPHCQHCNWTFYNNPIPAVGVFPIKDNKVLLAERAVDPFKGQLDTIGGFIEANEHPEATVIRETKEETGLDVKIIELLGMYTDIYGDEGKNTLNIHYIVDIIGGNLKASDDVKRLVWIDLDKLSDFKAQGFENTRQAIKDLYAWHQRTKIK